MKSNPSSRKTSRGFTLAELLVAMTITILLVLLTLTITGTAMDAWRDARTEIRAAGQAKAMLNALGRDLESMISRLGNNRTQWLVATTNPTPPGPGDNASPNASRLVFFTTASDRYDGNAGSQERQNGGGGANRNADRGGDVSAVSYQLDYVDPIAGSNNQRFSTFVLYRKLLEPDFTYQRSLIPDGTNANATASNLIGDFDASAGNNNLADMVCENVYDFTATFVINFRDATGVQRTVRRPVMGGQAGGDILNSFAITGAGLEPNQRPNSEIAGGRIASVELAITVLSDEAVERMKRVPFRSASEKQQFLEKHSYRYTRSVIIPQS
jgi:type II secretory pathway pseudopilin PulG